MTFPGNDDRTSLERWARAVTIVFLVVGMGFGTWLSRLPAVRDQLGASAAEMSIYGLCLALGSLVGLSFSGRLVHRFGPRQVLLAGTVVSAIALPSAAAIILHGPLPAGLAVLFCYGAALSICDVAMNVSGANAESALKKPKMPLMHAGYSLGAVTATGIGALAEVFGVPVPLHFAIVMASGLITLLTLVRFLPHDEHEARMAATQPRPPATGSIPTIDSAAGQQPAFHPVTGSIPIQSPNAPSGTAGGNKRPGSPARYSPWRDPRILFIGLITLSFGLFEGTASDWLPLALVDGRGASNHLGSTMLSVFFAAIMSVRLIGSLLITRWGRTAVLRVSAIMAACGVTMTILLPGDVGMTIGVIAWGFGASLGWPISISAAADDPDTAARDVAAVSAVGYGAMLVGPMSFGFLGEHIGLLNSFWALLPFAVYVVFAARVARTR